jgi:hypothetical protein
MGSSEYEEPVTDRMRRLAGGAAESMTDTAQSAAQSVADTAQSAAQRVQRAPEMIKSQARGNPIAAGIVAFGVGALFATMFPETRTERRLVGAAQPQLQHAADEARGAGRDLAQGAKQHGQEAAEQVRIAGSEAASTVADQAKGSAQQVASDVRRA